MEICLDYPIKTLIIWWRRDWINEYSSITDQFILLVKDGSTYGTWQLMLISEAIKPIVVSKKWVLKQETRRQFKISVPIHSLLLPPCQFTSFRLSDFSYGVCVNFSDQYFFPFHILSRKNYIWWRNSGLYFGSQLYWLLSRNYRLKNHTFLRSRRDSMITLSLSYNRNHDVKNKLVYSFIFSV